MVYLLKNIEIYKVLYRSKNLKLIGMLKVKGVYMYLYVYLCVWWRGDLHFLGVDIMIAYVVLMNIRFNYVYIHIYKRCPKF